MHRLLFARIRSHRRRCTSTASHATRGHCQLINVHLTFAASANARKLGEQLAEYQNSESDDDHLYIDAYERRNQAENSRQGSAKVRAVEKSERNVCMEMRMRSWSFLNLTIVALY